MAAKKKTAEELERPYPGMTRPGGTWIVHPETGWSKVEKPSKKPQTTENAKPNEVE